LAERNECISFAIGRPVNPGLEVALHVHRRGGGVDPSGKDEGERCKGPK